MFVFVMRLGVQRKVPALHFFSYEKKNMARAEYSLHIISVLCRTWAWVFLDFLSTPIVQEFSSESIKFALFWHERRVMNMFFFKLNKMQRYARLFLSR